MAPTVTVLIPARNEQKDIERCLQAVLDQDHPHGRLEIVLVDGASTDGTAHTAAEILGAGDIEWKVVDNPVGTTPSNLNAGLAVATGQYLCRVDARSLVPHNYVSVCAEVLGSRPDVAVVGGAQVAVALDGSIRAASIARALNNRFAMGGSRYRSGAPSGQSDTVYLGAFRTADLRAAGGWDEHFETNQDYELNRRMGRQATVWFDDRLSVGYVPRRSLIALYQQYHRFGRWKVAYWRMTGDRPRPRQVAALSVAASAAVAAMSVLVRSRRPGRALLGLLTAAVSFGLLIDQAGASRPATPPTRLCAAACVYVVTGAWVSGVVAELVETRSGASNAAE